MSQMWRKVYHAFRGWANGLAGESAAPRRTEITVETDRIWIVRRSRSTRCSPEDGRELNMLAPGEAETLLQEESGENRANSGTDFKSDEI